MIVASATDRRFVELAGVMLASLFANGETGDWPVVVFGFRLRAREKEKLKASAGVGAHTLRFIDVDPTTEALRALPANIFSISPSIFLRLLMPSLLADSGRLLYLDSDTLVLGSLRPLAEIDLAGFPVAAVEDAATHPSRGARFAFPENARYFNSGVMVIDLDAWRRDDLAARALKYVRDDAYDLFYPDQDALNLALAGRFLPLPPEWNVTRPTAEAGVHDARIVHFAATKPGSATCKHPDRALYFQYRAMTPWCHRRIATRFETRLARSIHKRRVALNRFLRASFGH